MINLEQISIRGVSEDAVLLSWPDVIAPAIAEQMSRIQRRLKKELGDKIIETVASYSSLIVYYRFDLITYEQLTSQLSEQIVDNDVKEIADTTGDIVNIPVFYSGWDLDDVSQKTGLTIEEIVDIHSKHHYTAYAHGFVPGFCYLASIEKKIQLPRKVTPRQYVPAGAVAIANEQTAVYPLATPGGWHILGFTPKKLFAINQQHFTPTIALGQTVKFTPISQQAFLDLGGQLMEER